MFTVADKAQQVAHDKLRTTPAARGLDGRPDHFQAIGQIGRLHTMASHPITYRLVEQILACELAIVRRGIRILVICHNDHQGKLLDRGHIDPFVKRPGRGAAVAETRRTDNTCLPAKSARHQGTRDHRNHCAKMADHRVITFARPPPMDVPVAAAHRAKLRSEIGAQRVQNGIAKGHSPGLIAYQRRENIALAKIDANGDAQCLLAAPQKDAAFDQTATVEAGELLLEHARHEHDAVSFEIFRT